jgi:hypothetical protein
MYMNIREKDQKSNRILLSIQALESLHGKLKDENLYQGVQVTLSSNLRMWEYRLNFKETKCFYFIFNLSIWCK